MLRTFDPFTATNSTSVDYDVVRTADGVSLFVDVPGVDPESVDLTVDNRSLTLKAERTQTLPEGATVTARRRRSGKIAQVFHLGNQLDAEKLSAEVLNGVLTVTIPVAESAKPRKVAVGVGAAPAIDASSTES